MAAVDTVSTGRPDRVAVGPYAPASADFPWRVLILLNLFRLTVAWLLLGILSLVDAPRIVGDSNPRLALFALLGMSAVGCFEFVTLRRRRLGTTLHIFLQFAGDLAAIIALIHSSGGISSGVGGVLVVSVGTLALLLPRDRAFLLAALTTLALLLEQTLAQFQGMTSGAQYASAGILGAVVFVITAVVQAMRSRMVETEALAAQRGLDLRNLVELNEYIIQHLRESIVVVDPGDQVRLINESAVKHLNAMGEAAGRDIAAISPELAAQLQLWRASSPLDDHAPRTFTSMDGSTTVRPHFAPLGSGRSGGVVIFLEDTSLIAERVQQTKLAALGRLSASIAHEIRNPIGAMSHAGQLLAESFAAGSEEHRLTDIIRVNARRVSQIVESILAISRRDKTRPERLNVSAWLRNFAAEFSQTLELYEGALTVHATATELEVQMDPTHLHQIVWNLCDNAVKYASATAGAIAVELDAGRLETSGRPFVEVADRGPGIAPDKVEQIFEPFYTGQPGGTGLGLYISRELAERNGATLRYYPRPGGGSLFRIVFADPHRWQSSREVL